MQEQNKPLNILFQVLNFDQEEADFINKVINTPIENYESLNMTPKDIKAFNRIIGLISEVNFDHSKIKEVDIIKSKFYEIWDKEIKKTSMSNLKVYDSFKDFLKKENINVDFDIAKNDRKIVNDFVKKGLEYFHLSEEDKIISMKKTLRDHIGHAYDEALERVVCFTNPSILDLEFVKGFSYDFIPDKKLKGMLEDIIDDFENSTYNEYKTPIAKEYYDFAQQRLKELNEKPLNNNTFGKVFNQIYSVDVRKYLKNEINSYLENIEYEEENNTTTNNNTDNLKYTTDSNSQENENNYVDDFDYDEKEVLEADEIIDSKHKKLSSEDIKNRPDYYYEVLDLFFGEEMNKGMGIPYYYNYDLEELLENYNFGSIKNFEDICNYEGVKNRFDIYKIYDEYRFTYYRHIKAQIARPSKRNDNFIKRMMTLEKEAEPTLEESLKIFLDANNIITDDLKKASNDYDIVKRFIQQYNDYYYTIYSSNNYNDYVLTHRKFIHDNLRNVAKPDQDIDLLNQTFFHFYVDELVPIDRLKFMYPDDDLRNMIKKNYQDVYSEKYKIYKDELEYFTPEERESIRLKREEIEERRFKKQPKKAPQNILESKTEYENLTDNINKKIDKEATRNEETDFQLAQIEDEDDLRREIEYLDKDINTPEKINNNGKILYTDEAEKIKLSSDGGDTPSLSYLKQQFKESKVTLPNGEYVDVSKLISQYESSLDKVRYTNSGLAAYQKTLHYTPTESNFNTNIPEIRNIKDIKKTIEKLTQHHDDMSIILKEYGYDSDVIMKNINSILSQIKELDTIKDSGAKEFNGKIINSAYEDLIQQYIEESNIPISFVSNINEKNYNRYIEHRKKVKTTAQKFYDDLMFEKYRTLEEPQAYEARLNYKTKYDKNTKQTKIIPVDPVHRISGVGKKIKSYSKPIPEEELEQLYQQLKGTKEIEYVSTINDITDVRDTVSKNLFNLEEIYQKLESNLISFFYSSFNQTDEAPRVDLLPLFSKAEAKFIEQIDNFYNSEQIKIGEGLKPIDLKNSIEYKNFSTFKKYSKLQQNIIMGSDFTFEEEKTVLLAIEELKKNLKNVFIGVLDNGNLSVGIGSIEESVFGKGKYVDVYEEQVILKKIQDLFQSGVPTSEIASQLEEIKNSHIADVKEKERKLFKNYTGKEIYDNVYNDIPLPNKGIGKSINDLEKIYKYDDETLYFRADYLEGREEDFQRFEELEDLKQKGLSYDEDEYLTLKNKLEEFKYAYANSREFNNYVDNEYSRILKEESQEAADSFIETVNARKALVLKNGQLSYTLLPVSISGGYGGYETTAENALYTLNKHRQINSSRLTSTNKNINIQKIQKVKALLNTYVNQTRNATKEELVSYFLDQKNLDDGISLDLNQIRSNLDSEEYQESVKKYLKGKGLSHQKYKATVNKQTLKFGKKDITPLDPRDYLKMLASKISTKEKQFVLKQFGFSPSEDFTKALANTDIKEIVTVLSQMKNPKLKVSPDVPIEALDELLQAMSDKQAKGLSEGYRKQIRIIQEHTEALQNVTNPNSVIDLEESSNRVKTLREFENKRFQALSKEEQQIVRDRLAEHHIAKINNGLKSIYYQINEDFNEQEQIYLTDVNKDISDLREQLSEIAKEESFENGESKNKLVNPETTNRHEQTKDKFEERTVYEYITDSDGKTKKVAKMEYVLDENGNQVLDQNGKPLMQEVKERVRVKDKKIVDKDNNLSAEMQSHIHDTNKDQFRNYDKELSLMDKMQEANQRRLLKNQKGMYNEIAQSILEQAREQVKIIDEYGSYHVRKLHILSPDSVSPSITKVSYEDILEGKVLVGGEAKEQIYPISPNGAKNYNFTKYVPVDEVAEYHHSRFNFNNYYTNRTAESIQNNPNLHFSPEEWIEGRVKIGHKNIDIFQTNLAYNADVITEQNEEIRNIFHNYLIKKRDLHDGVIPTSEIVTVKKEIEEAHNLIRSLGIRTEELNLLEGEAETKYDDLLEVWIKNRQNSIKQSNIHWQKSEDNFISLLAKRDDTKPNLKDTRTLMMAGVPNKEEADTVKIKLRQAQESGKKVKLPNYPYLMTVQSVSDGNVSLKPDYIDPKNISTKIKLEAPEEKIDNAVSILLNTMNKRKYEEGITLDTPKGDLTTSNFIKEDGNEYLQLSKDKKINITELVKEFDEDIIELPIPGGDSKQSSFVPMNKTLYDLFLLSQPDEVRVKPEDLAADVYEIPRNAIYSLTKQEVIDTATEGFYYLEKVTKTDSNGKEIEEIVKTSFDGFNILEEDLNSERAQRAIRVTIQKKMKAGLKKYHYEKKNSSVSSQAPRFLYKVINDLENRNIPVTVDNVKYQLKQISTTNPLLIDKNIEDNVELAVQLSQALGNDQANDLTKSQAFTEYVRDLYFKDPSELTQEELYSAMFNFSFVDRPENAVDAISIADKVNRKSKVIQLFDRLYEGDFSTSEGLQDAVSVTTRTLNDSATVMKEFDFDIGLLNEEKNQALVDLENNLIDLRQQENELWNEMNSKYTNIDNLTAEQQLAKDELNLKIDDLYDQIDAIEAEKVSKNDFFEKQIETIKEQRKQYVTNFKRLYGIEPPKEYNYDGSELFTYIGEMAREKHGTATSNSLLVEGMNLVFYGDVQKLLDDKWFDALPLEEQQRMYDVLKDMGYTVETEHLNTLTNETLTPSANGLYIGGDNNTVYTTTEQNINIHPDLINKVYVDNSTNTSVFDSIFLDTKKLETPPTSGYGQLLNAPKEIPFVLTDKDWHNRVSSLHTLDNLNELRKKFKLNNLYRNKTEKNQLAKKGLKPTPIKLSTYDLETTGFFDEAKDLFDVIEFSRLDKDVTGIVGGPNKYSSPLFEGNSKRVTLFKKPKEAISNLFSTKESIGTLVQNQKDVFNEAIKNFYNKSADTFVNGLEIEGDTLFNVVKNISKYNTADEFLNRRIVPIRDKHTGEISELRFYKQDLSEESEEELRRVISNELGLTKTPPPQGKNFTNDYSVIKADPKIGSAVDVYAQSQVKAAQSTVNFLNSASEGNIISIPTQIRKIMALPDTEVKVLNEEQFNAAVEKFITDTSTTKLNYNGSNFDDPILLQKAATDYIKDGVSDIQFMTALKEGTEEDLINPDALNLYRSMKKSFQDNAIDLLPIATVANIEQKNHKLEVMSSKFNLSGNGPAHIALSDVATTENFLARTLYKMNAPSTDQEENLQQFLDSLSEKETYYTDNSYFVKKFDDGIREGGLRRGAYRISSIVEDYDGKINLGVEVIDNVDNYVDGIDITDPNSLKRKNTVVRYKNAEELRKDILSNWQYIGEYDQGNLQHNVDLEHKAKKLFHSYFDDNTDASIRNALNRGYFKTSSLIISNPELQPSVKSFTNAMELHKNYIENNAYDGNGTLTSLLAFNKKHLGDMQKRLQEHAPIIPQQEKAAEILYDLYHTSEGKELYSALKDIDYLRKGTKLPNMDIEFETATRDIVSSFLSRIQIPDADKSSRSIRTLNIASNRYNLLSQFEEMNNFEINYGDNSRYLVKLGSNSPVDLDIDFSNYESIRNSINQYINAVKGSISPNIANIEGADHAALMTVLRTIMDDKNTDWQDMLEDNFKKKLRDMLDTNNSYSLPTFLQDYSNPVEAIASQLYNHSKNNTQAFQKLPKPSLSITDAINILKQHADNPQSNTKEYEAILKELQGTDPNYSFTNMAKKTLDNLITKLAGQTEEGTFLIHPDYFESLIQQRRDNEKVLQELGKNLFTVNLESKGLEPFRDLKKYADKIHIDENTPSDLKDIISKLREGKGTVTKAQIEKFGETLEPLLQKHLKAKNGDKDKYIQSVSNYIKGLSELTPKQHETLDFLSHIINVPIFEETQYVGKASDRMRELFESEILNNSVFEQSNYHELIDKALGDMDHWRDYASKMNIEDRFYFIHNHKDQIIEHEKNLGHLDEITEIIDGVEKAIVFSGNTFLEDKSLFEGAGIKGIPNNTEIINHIEDNLLHSSNAVMSMDGKPVTRESLSKLLMDIVSEKQSNISPSTYKNYEDFFKYLESKNLIVMANKDSSTYDMNRFLASGARSKQAIDNITGQYMEEVKLAKKFLNEEKEKAANALNILYNRSNPSHQSINLDLYKEQMTDARRKLGLIQGDFDFTLENLRMANTSAIDQATSFKQLESLSQGFNAHKVRVLDGNNNIRPITALSYQELQQQANNKYLNKEMQGVISNYLESVDSNLKEIMRAKGVTEENLEGMMKYATATYNKKANKVKELYLKERLEKEAQMIHEQFGGKKSDSIVKKINDWIRKQEKRPPDSIINETLGSKLNEKVNNVSDSIKKNTASVVETSNKIFNSNALKYSAIAGALALGILAIRNSNRRKRREEENPRADQAPRVDGTYNDKYNGVKHTPIEMPKTVRVEENGTGMNVNINARSKRGYSRDNVASAMNNTLQNTLNANVNFNYQDDTARIDQQYVQSLFSNALM